VYYDVAGDYVMSKTGVNSENNKKSDGNGLFRRFAGITMVGLATVTGGQAKTLADTVNDKEDVKTEYVSDNVSTPDDVKTYKFEASSSLAKDQSDKYMTNITVRNDSVAMVSGVQALYHPEKGDIRIRKGDFSFDDFGFKNAPDGKIEELLIIHEAEHEIDIEQKGVGTEKVSLNEFYQRDYHLEVGALIAEKLEIRRQFVKAQTDEEKKAFFEKFGKDVENKEYVNALRIGRFNPNSGNSQDFMKEMAFIKDSSIRFRCDPNDHSYHENTVENAMLYLAREGNNVKSNPSGFEKEVKAIYQIGGFDFSKVGNQDLYLMKGNSLDVADKLLESGADASKVINNLKDSNYNASIKVITLNEINLNFVDYENKDVRKIENTIDYISVLINKVYKYSIDFDKSNINNLAVSSGLSDLRGEVKVMISEIQRLLVSSNDTLQKIQNTLIKVDVILNEAILKTIDNSATGYTLKNVMANLVRSEYDLYLTLM
jgi:hypothetical protein